MISDNKNGNKCASLTYTTPNSGLTYTQYTVVIGCSQCMQQGSANTDL